MATIPDFVALTAEIIAFLTTDVGSLFNQILDEPPLSVQGNSPILSVHDDGLEPVDGTWKRWRVHYRATVYINRENTAAPETLLRTLRKAIFESLQGNTQGTNYQALVVSTRTQPSMEILDGVKYRLEELFFYCRADCKS